MKSASTAATQCHIASYIIINYQILYHESIDASRQVNCAFQGLTSFKLTIALMVKSSKIMLIYFSDGGRGVFILHCEVN